MNTKVKSLIYCSLGACMIAVGAQLSRVTADRHHTPDRTAGA